MRYVMKYVDDDGTSHNGGWVEWTQGKSDFRYASPWLEVTLALDEIKERGGLLTMVGGSTEEGSVDAVRFVRIEDEDFIEELAGALGLYGIYDISEAMRTYQYEGAQFQVTRTSPASANVVLQCGMHDHEEFIIGLREDEALGWALGRKASGNFIDGNFNDAVDKCAELLIEECNAMVQIDTFFSDS